MEYLSCQTSRRASKEVAPRIALYLASILPFLGAYIYFFLLSGTAVAMVAYSCVKLFTLVFPIAIVCWMEKHSLPTPSLGFCDSPTLLKVCYLDLGSVSSWQASSSTPHWET